MNGLRRGGRLHLDRLFRLLCGGRRRLSLRDRTKDRADADGLAFLDHNLGNNAGSGRVDLKRDFIRFEFSQGLVSLDRIPGLLEPFTDCGFRYRLAQGGNDDLNGHAQILRKHRKEEPQGTRHAAVQNRREKQARPPPGATALT